MSIPSEATNNRDFTPSVTESPLTKAPSTIPPVENTLIKASDTSLSIPRRPVIRIVKEIEQSWSIERIVQERTPHGWEELFTAAHRELKDTSDILQEWEQRGESFFPLKKDIFAAFHLTPLHRVKVVIVGQDPYPQWHPTRRVPRAQGFSFSVAKDDEIPGSLRSIYKELQDTVEGFRAPRHGDLTEWAQRGVLLLNTCLTVKPPQPDSHKKIWMGFVVKALNIIAEKRPQTVFLLWGRKAQEIETYLGDRVTYLEAAHPSPLSASKGFFGCDHFRQVNRLLVGRGEEPIDWRLTP